MLPKKPEFTAHLVLIMRTDKGIPSIMDVAITSSGPDGLTHYRSDMMYAEVMRVSGPSFQEARDHMMEVCRKSHHLSWTRMFLEPGRDVVAARSLMLEMLGRGMRNTKTAHTDWEEESDVQSG